MTDAAQRALVEALKRREAHLLCRRCGSQLDADRFCSLCGAMTPLSTRPAAHESSGRAHRGPSPTEVTDED